MDSIIVSIDVWIIELQYNIPRYLKYQKNIDIYYNLHITIAMPIFCNNFIVILTTNFLVQHIICHKLVTRLNTL